MNDLTRQELRRRLAWLERSALEARERLAEGRELVSVATLEIVGIEKMIDAIREDLGLAAEDRSDDDE